MKNFILFLLAFLAIACSGPSNITDIDSFAQSDADGHLTDDSSFTQDEADGQLTTDDSFLPDNDLPPKITIEDFGSPEILAQGFLFAEGPVWDSKAGTLVFSDIDKSMIYRMDETGKFSSAVTESFRSNGLLLDDDGSIIAASQTKRGIIKFAQQSEHVIVNSYDGKKFNAPNDLIKSSKGFIYFTDPLIGIKVEDSELGYAGVYSINKEGSVFLESKAELAPNGVALSPEENFIYVADTTGNTVYKYSISAEGHLTDKTVFAAVGSPDGITVDSAGNLYAATHDANDMTVSVFRPDGSPIGKIKLSTIPTNLEFGGTDGRSLFITAMENIIRVHAPVAGL